jgi:hypothetical protein
LPFIVYLWLLCYPYVFLSLADEVASNIRRTKLLLQKSKERRQFCQLQMRHRGNACFRRRQAEADLALVEAARQCPAAAAEALNAIKNICRQSKHSEHSTGSSRYEFMNIFSSSKTHVENNLNTVLRTTNKNSTSKL